jgi:hypothetical protein
MIEVIETHIVMTIIGFIVGVFTTKYYYERTVKNVALGRIIEFSMITKSIQNLNQLSSSLHEVIQGMNRCSEELDEQLRFSNDIEKSYQNNFKTPENGDEELEDELYEAIEDSQKYETIEDVQTV